MAKKILYQDNARRALERGNGNNGGSCFSYIRTKR